MIYYYLIVCFLFGVLETYNRADPNYKVHVLFMLGRPPERRTTSLLYIVNKMVNPNVFEVLYEVLYYAYTPLSVTIMCSLHCLGKS